MLKRLKQNRMKSLHSGNKILSGIFIIVLVLSFGKSSFAIGEVAVGANMGLTRDLNNIENDTHQYNMTMELYKEAYSGTKAKPVPDAFCLLWGLNMRYQFNFLLFRLGATYARSPELYHGYLKPDGGEKNKIKFTSYQCTFPLSIALLVPLKEKTYFYFGGGLSYHIAYIKIAQSDPDQTAGVFTDNNKRNR